MQHFHELLFIGQPHQRSSGGPTDTGVGECHELDECLELQIAKSGSIKQDGALLCKEGLALNFQ